MSRTKTIIIVALLIIVTNVAQGFIWAKTKANMELNLSSEIATLNATIDAIGPATTVWGVSGEVAPGDSIAADNLVEMSMPASMVTDSYVMDTSSIVGKYYKISIKPGTAITTDMIMADEMDDTLRDVDVYVDRSTVGLKVGDYVDYRITLPYGDDYIVLSHKRVQSIGAGTLKVYLNESEWHTYQGAQIDYYLNSQSGATVYVQKYVEPGVQQAAEVYYAVPKNIEAIMLLDPNILDKAQGTMNDSLRKSIDAILEQFKPELNITETEAGYLNAGRTKYNSSVNSDSSIFQDGGTDSATDETDVLDDVFVEEKPITDGVPATDTEDGGKVE